jgi:hypothetical protein
MEATDLSNFGEGCVLLIHVVDGDVEIVNSAARDLVVLGKDERVYMARGRMGAHSTCIIPRAFTVACVLAIGLCALK